jgi:hypothetical protein
VARFIALHFIPLQLNIHDPAQRLAFRRFHAIWTPTVVVLDMAGNERWRIEGYLPKHELHAQLEMGLARIVALRKRWAEAEPLYARIVEHFGDTAVAAEALYWRGISSYQVTRDHTSLERMALEVTSRFPQSEWAIKASVWV